MAEIELLSADDPGEFTETWYDLADEDHFWMRWRFAALTRELSRLGIDTSLPMQGLDIGCGYGAVLRQLSASTAWSIDGCDLNRAALSMISNHKGRVLFYNIHDRNLAFFKSTIFCCYSTLSSISKSRMRSFNRRHTTLSLADTCL